MKTYRICFMGRKLGAIGIFQTMIEFVEAEDKDKAVEKLYEKYDLYMYPSENCIQEVKGE